MNLNKKGQISIFIIIAIVIIILIVFLVNMNSNNNSRDLDKINKQVKSIDLDVISKELDTCVEFGLRKALIIAGSRGGLIYGDKNREYLRSNLPSGTYSQEFLQNLEIDLTSLETGILHVSDKLYFPSIDESIQNGFENSITENFERYLFEHIASECSNLKNFNKLGMNVEKTDPSGVIFAINNNGDVIVNSIDAKIDDRVRFYVDNNIYLGTITSISPQVIVKPDNSVNLITNTNLGGIVVYNLNSQIDVKVTFDDESVSAKVNYPIYTNSTKQETSSYATSFITLPVRFSQILQVSKNLMLAKIDKRSLNYGPNGDLNEVLNYESTYLKNTNLVNIDFNQNIIEDKLDCKLYTYTFIDKDSKILGIPFIFRMGYENTAPKFKENICQINNGECIINSNNIQMSLIDYVTEDNIDDSYKILFEPYNEITTTSSFSVSNQGELSFSATKKGRYPYDITVSDGETFRTQNIVFVVE